MPALRSMGPEMPRRMHCPASRTPTPFVRYFQMGFSVSSVSYSSTRPWKVSVKACTDSTKRASISAARPPIRRKLGVRREPERVSKMSMRASRSRRA